jgi:GNAT superfamily N-acetyltransferase
VAASNVAALVIGALLVAALVLAVVLIPLSRRAKRQRAGLEEELGDSMQRSANARGLGLESRGRGQVRGNGWLVLTDDELRFRQWVPQRDTTIPLAAVTAVGTERTWLGKWVGSRLLRVRWRTASDGEDAMAWQVPELEEWVAALERRCPPGG